MYERNDWYWSLFGWARWPKSNEINDDGINRQFCGHKCRSACPKVSQKKNDDKFVTNSIIFRHLDFGLVKRRARNCRTNFWCYVLHSFPGRKDTQQKTHSSDWVRDAIFTLRFQFSKVYDMDNGNCQRFLLQVPRVHVTAEPLHSRGWDKTIV